MKEVTVIVPDEKFQFFMELAEHLGIEAIQNDIPEEHKNIVRERMRGERFEEMIPWKDARKKIIYKKS